MKRTLAVLLAAAAIPLAGCGSSDDPEPAAASAPAGATVEMVDNAFEAEDVTVSAGDTVTWTNAGVLPHTATGDGFDSGSVAPGETFSWVAEKPGTVSYVCTFHPGMEGTITVR